ncbi:MAG: ISAzo13 family transposase [Verrucomicrobia bacterium]|nr:MAG: ISAzo13 family transposase [Verrucomicrobiota bacterium]
MQDAQVIARIGRKFRRLAGALNERSRRLWAASEALELGWGGVSAVAQATNLSPTTIRAGIGELKKPKRRALSPDRIRRPGAGRQRATQRDPGLRSALEGLVEPTSRGDPEASLQWTIKSTRTLARELVQQEHPVSYRTVGALLEQTGYSLQANRKTREGTAHPDRNAQFEYINGCVRRFQRRGQPAISVDTKKKELVGDFKNGGRDWRPQGKPQEVRVHDFLDKTLGKAIPYGVYDLLHNEGWVSVGIDHDTAQFAVNAIGCWWRKMGRRRFPRAQELLISADSGGSNSARCRLWKVALQELANATGLTVTVCHFPPGTSKWNKIEHRLFSFIAQNWRGQPLVSLQTIVELIGHTRTAQGLKVCAALDTNDYPKGIEITDEQLARVKLQPHNFHGEWNYTIRAERKT